MKTYRIFVFLVLATGCTTPSIVATQSIQLGDAMYNQSQYEKAIRHYEEYLEISPTLGLYRNPVKEAEVLRKLAHAHATQGRYSVSSGYLNNAMAIDTTLGNNQLAIAEDFRQKGLLEAYLGNYLQAVKYLERTIWLSEGMEKSIKDTKKLSLAETYLSLAQVHQTMGDYKEAKGLAEQANTIFGSVSKGEEGKMECFLLLGAIAREMSLPEESMKWTRQSMDMAKRLHLNTARQNQAIGDIFFLKGDYEEGIRYKLEALKEARQANIVPQVIAAYMRLGDAFMQLGDKQKANDYYQQAWVLQNGIEDDSVSNTSLRMRLGDVEGSLQKYIRSGSQIGAGIVSLKMCLRYINRENWDSAQAYARQSKFFFEKAGNNEGVAKANLTMATLLNKQDRMKEAIALIDKVKGQTLQPDLQWQALYQEGIAYEALGDFEEALKAYEGAVGIIDAIRGNLTIEEFKSLFADSKVAVYDRLINLIIRHGQGLGLTPDQVATQSFDYNEHSRSRAFLDMMGNKKISPKSNADNQLLEEEQLLRLKIQQLIRELDTNPKANRQVLLGGLKEARLSHDRVVQEIKLNNPAYATVSGVVPPTLLDIQSNLSDDAAIVEYWVGEEALHIWAVTRDAVKTKSVEISKTELARQITLSRRYISAQLPQPATNTLQGLYGLLFEPIREFVEGSKSLIIVPHRSLHFLPFQALISKEKKYLIERYVVSYAPSSAIWRYCNSTSVPNHNKFLGMALGGITIGDAPPLPGTTEEVEQISKIYTEFKTLEGKEFTESEAKKEVANYDYIHVATHGRFNSREPMYSYLLMGNSNEDDGKLTVTEIMDMQINSRFVTLSACETGLGGLSEGDDLIGMSRAFIYAGAPQVVVSLWKVDDATTSWLMTRFHQYVRGGARVSESLAHAQRDLLNQEVGTSQDVAGALANRSPEQSRTPYYWAPFVVIGSDK
ncbi:MAG: CHAT domain-containing protein [Cyclobacteriaceae bacterium]|nr:CHAT domain-containing protein [Cyclobacteriaceae bacterium]MCB0497972.1 CHAT domain-containing protein [Cyclobacteriaceae bacterium]MCB9238696.1 CHAT domain-containing protein [Flammeovirgaceae bacterium]MCO5271854.1 CHAT domain-containing protein [Cyclobacteriaceae bacterium]MCW5901144.1 CHAT domain-containing protein [Cyclobacteriaceae bacterium]